MRFFYKHLYLLIIAAWCITLSFIIDNYWADNSSVNSVKKKLETHIHQQEKNFSKFIKDTALLNKIASQKYDEFFLKSLIQKEQFLYLYQQKDVGVFNAIFWNTQSVMPSDSILNSTALSGFLKLPNGYYVWNKALVNNNIVIALIKVKSNYILTNEYLKNTFVIGNGLDNNYDIALEGGDAAVNDVNGNSIFYLNKNSGSIVQKNNSFSVALRITAALLVLILVHLCANFIAINNRLWKAASFIIIVVVSLRVISYFYQIPINFRQLNLFAPTVYSSNLVLRSLGDLLINALLFTWVILFIRHQLQTKSFILATKFHKAKWFWLALASIVFITATFIAGHILKGMVADSQISFDVINFFTLNVYSFVGFIVLCCIAIGYFLLGQILLYLLRPMFPQNFIPLYLSVTILGLSLLTIGYNYAIVTFELYLLIWLLIYLLLLSSNYFILLTTRISASRFVFWVFFFSISITFVIVQENNVKELANRKHYAEALSTKADPSSEILMNTLLTDFRNNILAANFYKFKKKSSNQFFKDSLVSGNFSGYNNKYDTKIYSFDENEKPLFNVDSTSYNELNSVLNTQAKPTSNPDLFFYDESYDRYAYISKKEIRDTANQLLGQIFILARSKKYKSDAITPELFSKGSDNAIENSSVYSYAVYTKLQLVSNHNDYAFATKLTKQQIPKEEFVINKKNGFDELWYKAGPQNVVIIAKEDNLFIESITLFSYLFCSFLLVTGIFWVINIFIKSRINKTSIKSYLQLSIRNQIHGTIIFISVLSFLVIGIATILFFIQRYQNNNRERLSRTINVMENEVRTSLSELIVFDDVIKIYDDGFKQKLEATIMRISEIHVADINVYDLEVNLKVS